MAPVAISTSLTSPPGPPAGKSQIAAMNKDQGLTIDGNGTPYSSTSTAVSESGGSPKEGHNSAHIGKVLAEDNLPRATARPGQEDYYTSLLHSSAAVATTKPGSTVYATAIEVLEALAVQNSESVWVYDDAAAVGFGARLAKWDNVKVHKVQTRQGAGLELAGYSQKTSGLKLSVFASTTTLPHLLENLDLIKGDVVINVAATTLTESLEIKDSLFEKNVVRSLASLPEDWQVVFSSSNTVDIAAKVYGTEGKKTVHVVDSTYFARETTSYTFPSASSQSIEEFSLINAEANDVVVIPAGHLASSLDVPQTTALLTLNTLNPSPESLFTALTGTEKKTVQVVGGTKADADALKAVILSALYSASGSSKAVFPTIKSTVATTPSDLFDSVAPGPESKTVSFYTAPLSPLAQLLAHLFMSSPSLITRLAEFGSSSTRGLKSVLALSPSSATPAPIDVHAQSDVTWVSDANVLKQTDVLSNAAPGGLLVLELPWSEEEVPAKLSRAEISTIKEKNLRVFLLDLDANCSLNPIKEQVAFLLLYTGSQRLPNGVKKVLDAFHNGHLGRDEVEEAQAGLLELDSAAWSIPELEEGKTEKIKSVWEWDALDGATGLIDLSTDDNPVKATWDHAARHLLFKEAFAVEQEEKTLFKNDDKLIGPAVKALRPSMADETFLVTVTENRRLTPLTYDRNVFHLELDTAGTGLKYDIGEAIGIHGWNDAQEVLDFCSWYGLEPEALVSFPNPLKSGTIETRTIFQLLQQNVDLFGRPGKAFYAALSKLATKKSDAMTLKFISAPEGAELFKKMAENETVTFADVLYRFRTARPSIEELVGLIPEIKPRHYSIASSQKAIGDKVELLIVTVDWISSTGEYLARTVRSLLTGCRLPAIRSVHAIPRRTCPRSQGHRLDQAVRHEAPT